MAWFSVMPFVEEALIKDNPNIKSLMKFTNNTPTRIHQSRTKLHKNRAMNSDSGLDDLVPSRWSTVLVAARIMIGGETLPESLRQLQKMWVCFWKASTTVTCWAMSIPICFLCYDYYYGTEHQLKCRKVQVITLVSWPSSRWKARVAAASIPS